MRLRSSPVALAASALLCALLSFGSITACSITGNHASIPVGETTASTGEVKIMINDLFSALAQILPPIQTTVQISSGVDTSLYAQVAETFALRGYGVQRVSTDQGPMLVSTALDEMPATDEGESARLRITIGPVSISRSYTGLSSDNLQPASTFRLYGTRASVDVASTLFGSDINVDSTIAAVEYSAPFVTNEPPPVIALITPDLVQQISEQATNAPSATAVNSANLEINNLFFADSSFNSVLDNYQSVEKLNVIFPNDSIVLGEENKLLVRRFTERFSESSDMISLIGCSNGPTDSELGNEGLALGRAERITRELLSLGVPRNNILDEGCWSSEYRVEGFPSRGVVLQRWRAST